ncbi:PIN domain-containing protein [Natronoglycomyces albus]|uniref:Type II toxin-antitoxin system VapC family toxin n=1 Tax=Natronoglycomyces albus TaxID=2811108 RepID=A0A895XRJ8_9ACTN|nr:type II toxin-antitoxin system VapC family toxin [Natronoglycomyces albus]QSB05805.1 type II toxin-antitoxin system VapC family toxin [Natronoglycomyces albus]
MIGLDTNVLVRFLTNDDPKRSEIAARSIETLSEERPGYISHIVLVELYWVLTSKRGYAYSVDEATGAMARLIDAREIVAERADLVRTALKAAQDGAGFADALITARNHDAGCSDTVTFDKGAANNAGMRLLT